MTKPTHRILQDPPWPPHPSANFMYSRFKCMCGWSGDLFRDVRGEKGVTQAREIATQHARLTEPDPRG